YLSTTGTMLIYVLLMQSWDRWFFINCLRGTGYWLGISRASSGHFLSISMQYIPKFTFARLYLPTFGDQLEGLLLYKNCRKNDNDHIRLAKMLCPM
ncbi:hypothetical protein ACJX0J_018555, partial [Zea mays]